GQVNAAASDAFVPAPQGLVGLDGFLDAEILPNLPGIAAHVLASRAAESARPERVLAFLGAPPSAEGGARRGRASRPPGPAAGSLVFMPTNGVGLGHAQRCTLIAHALAPAHPRPAFAVFPSCAGLVKAHGFDVMPLVGRSALHAQSHEPDLANYLRLRALTAGARALIFDGGYIFDSVYRTALRRDIAGIWIRRGLWPTGQDNSIALDREKAFDRVIVPDEAFDELNTPYSRGAHLTAVGPIVQTLRPDRATIRGDLAERYDRPFERLAVTLLGSGVAAGRGTQVQALCGLFERRSDTLHLVVAWPNAALEPGWFGWRNSRVVRTRHAAILAAAADVAVTAAGYNSFHEVLYNRVAAIFVPQTGGFMDDQRARARAACDRELASMAEANELMTLERLVCRYLDDGEAEALRARLAMAELPAPGTRRAAQIIEEAAFGPDALDLDPAADRPA
ncbi:MAG TPA: glycosyltransferase, partial [Amaricoccus sp.]|nr:glycosyltransferase [Amaricoccus sp.]